MADYQNEALFGTGLNSSYMGASMLNGEAESDSDWGSILANGIRGAAQAAISASVGEKFASGQLVNQTQQVAKSNSTRNLLLVAAAAYLLLKA